jgi:hypothetical protein
MDLKIFFNWPITNSHIIYMIGTQYGNFVQDTQYIIPSK